MGNVFDFNWIVVQVLLFMMNYNKLYSVPTFIFSTLTGLIVLKQPSFRISGIWRIFIIVIIPFFIINGVLTEAFTEQPVVWYNENEFMGIRIVTIPLEDIFYNYTLIVGIILLRDYFLNSLTKKH